MSKLEISVIELKKLMQWIADKQLLDQNVHVTIESSNTGGIGISTQAFIKTADGEGIYKDLTDYENW